ncbi:hypothetical protein EFB08_00005, partial [Rufibacter latericius]
MTIPYKERGRGMNPPASFLIWFLRLDRLSCNPGFGARFRQKGAGLDRRENLPMPELQLPSRGYRSVSGRDAPESGALKKI